MDCEVAAIGRLYISITLFPPSVRSWEKVEIELKVTLLKASTSSRSSFTEETPQGKFHRRKNWLSGRLSPSSTLSSWGKVSLRFSHQVFHRTGPFLMCHSNDHHHHHHCHQYQHQGCCKRVKVQNGRWPSVGGFARGGSNTVALWYHPATTTRPPCHLANFTRFCPRFDLKSSQIL